VSRQGQWMTAQQVCRHRKQWDTAELSQTKNPTLPRERNSPTTLLAITPVAALAHATARTRLANPAVKESDAMGV
jgi:hypothetical protein